VLECSERRFGIDGRRRSASSDWRSDCNLARECGQPSGQILVSCSRHTFLFPVLAPQFSQRSVCSSDWVS
jgi:hypothetical protein